MADILEVNILDLKQLVTSDDAISSEKVAEIMAVSNEIVWNHNFLFLVDSLQEAQLTFTLMCIYPKGDIAEREAIIGSITCLLTDLVTPDANELSPLDEHSPFQIGSNTLGFDGTNALLTLKMSVHAYD